MSIAKIYFILGLAMLLVVLWDYRKLPATARRLTKQPPGEAAQPKRSSQSEPSQFSRIALDVRNLTVMALVAFFLWPVVIVLELLGSKDR